MVVPIDQVVQQVAAAIPPIKVTVQQPPGMPLWETALISASVGTILGVASSVAVEFVKPAIAKWQLKKVMLEQLKNEMVFNWAIVLSGIRILEDGADKPEKQGPLVGIMTRLKDGMRNDRFEHYFEKEKLFYTKWTRGIR